MHAAVYRPYDYATSWICGRFLEKVCDCLKCFVCTYMYVAGDAVFATLHPLTLYEHRPVYHAPDSLTLNLSLHLQVGTFVALGLPAGVWVNMLQNEEMIHSHAPMQGKLHV